MKPSIIDEALALIVEVGTIDAMKWLAKKAAEDEREACAQIALYHRIPMTYSIIDRVANDIMARGKA